MKNIIYGIYAEDDANKLFVLNVIPKLITHFDYAEKISLQNQVDFTSPSFHRFYLNFKEFLEKSNL
jgi:hypothetical protein